MTKLTITSAFAAAAAATKNPWVINNGVDLKGPFAGREAARAAKAEQELGGKIEKFELGNFEVEAAIPTTTIFAFGSHGLTNCPCCGTHGWKWSAAMTPVNPDASACCASAITSFGANRSSMAA